MTPKTTVHGIAKFNNVYRLTAELADGNGYRVFYTEDGAFAEKALNFTRKVVNEINSYDTSIFVKITPRFAEPVLSVIVDGKTKYTLEDKDPSQIINLYYFIQSLFSSNFDSPKFAIACGQEEVDKTPNIKLDLVKFQSHYRVVANVDDKTFSYATKNESLAEDILNFTRKVVNATDETGDTPIFDTGETADGDYMIMATIGAFEYYLNVDTQNSADEISEFLETFIPF